MLQNIVLSPDPPPPPPPTPRTVIKRTQLSTCSKATATKTTLSNITLRIQLGNTDLCYTPTPHIGVNTFVSRHFHFPVYIHTYDTTWDGSKSRRVRKIWIYITVKDTRNYNIPKYITMRTYIKCFHESCGK